MQEKSKTLTIISIVTNLIIVIIYLNKIINRNK